MFSVDDIYVLSLKLYITRYCPMDCTYCFVKEKKKWLDMDYETAKKSIDFFLFWESWIKNIYIMGGEPLTREDFIISLIDYVKHNYNTSRLNFIIVTWWLISISVKLKKIIQDNHFIKVSVSFDGLEKFHNTSRKTISWKDTYNIISNNLKQYLEVEKYWCAITLPENPDFIKSIYKGFLNINKNYNFKMFHIWIVWSNWSKDNIILFIREYKKILDYILYQYNQWYFTYSIFFNRTLIHELMIKAYFPELENKNIVMLDIDYNWNVWEVMNAVSDESKVYFNINDSFQNIQSFNLQWPKFLYATESTNMDYYIKRLHEKYSAKIWTDYLQSISDNNLYF